MSLEACPICGYAVSIETSKCRHCEEASKSIFSSGIVKSANPLFVWVFWSAIFWQVLLLYNR